MTATITTKYSGRIKWADEPLEQIIDSPTIFGNDDDDTEDAEDAKKLASSPTGTSVSDGSGRGDVE